MDSSIASRHADGDKPRSGLVPCLVAIIALTGFIAYASSLSGVFVLDDIANIVDDQAIRTLPPDFDQSSFGVASRPVGTWSLALNYRLGRLSPWAYHVANVAIHLAAAVLLFDLIRRTLMLRGSASWPSKAGASKANHAVWLAGAVALIWMVHPLQTQSVTYVVQRLESMMGLFYLACMYCVLRGSQSRSDRWYYGAIVCCFLGMGTKEVMATAPFVILIYDRVFLARCWKSLWLRRWWVYLGFLAALAWLVVYLVPQTTSRTDASAGFSWGVISPLTYLMTQGGVILHYLRLTVWPDSLCFDYLWPFTSDWKAAAIPCLAVALLLLSAVVTLGYRPRLGFLMVTFFLILAPTSSFMPIADAAVEHRMYLPLAPLVILSVLGGYWLVGRIIARERARCLVQAMAIALVVAAFTGRTVIRNRDYSSTTRLWTSVLQVAPHNWTAYGELAQVAVQEGRMQDAMRHYERMAQYAQGSRAAVSLVNYGNLFARQGKYAAAMARYERALELDPSYEPARRYHRRAADLLRESAADRPSIQQTGAIGDERRGGWLYSAVDDSH